jgi:hypothetical protein
MMFVGRTNPLLLVTAQTQQAARHRFDEGLSSFSSF